MANESMFGVLGQATELRQRILFTLGALIVYRLGTYIPVPGINAAALSEMAAELVENDIEKVASGNEEGVRLVVKALISSGVAMSIAGTSRPASGGEHKFSHWLDSNHDNPALHGEQCGVGSIVTMFLHGGDWNRIRNTLRAVNAPINSRELGRDDSIILEALIKSKEIRPQRITILDNSTQEQIEEAALATEVIG